MMRMSFIRGCVAGIYSDFSGFILALWCDSWPEFSTQKSPKFLIILLYDLDSMPHFSVFLSIFYHPRIRVKCGLYCFCSHFLLLVELFICNKNIHIRKAVFRLKLLPFA
jgi:hypothetical protein